MAPVKPESTTKTLVREGIPPTIREISIAIGVVTDFGAIDNNNSVVPPNNFTVRTAISMAVSVPAATLVVMRPSC